jgi:hypothetical protein
LDLLNVDNGGEDDADEDDDDDDDGGEMGENVSKSLTNNGMLLALLILFGMYRLLVSQESSVRSDSVFMLLLAVELVPPLQPL